MRRRAKVATLLTVVIQQGEVAMRVVMCKRSDAAVERLHERVLPRAAGLDKRCAGAAEPAPVPQGVGGHLRPVVTPDELRMGATLTNDPVEHVNDPVGRLVGACPKLRLFEFRSLAVAIDAVLRPNPG